MKRVWLSMSLWVVSVLGMPWLGSPVRGDDCCPYPGVDASCESQCEHPYWEKMRAFGECHWYHDEEYRPADVCELVPDEPTPDQLAVPTPEMVPVECAPEPAIQAPPASAVVDSADCWYDGETDAYYHHDFADEAVATSEPTLTEETDTCPAPACPEEAYVESGCLEMAPEACETADVATEEAWGGDDWYADDEGEDSHWDDELYSEDESSEAPYVEPTYSEPGEPVQTWIAPEVEVVEGEDCDEVVPPAPSSELVEFDGDVILSVARTLDRVGVTLQALSHYLTEVAAAQTASHGETLQR